MFAASFMIREKKIITQKIELQIESKTVIAYNKSGVCFPISRFSNTVESRYSKPLYNKVLGITDHTLRPSAVKPFNTNTDGAVEVTV